MALSSQTSTIFTVSQLTQSIKLQLEHAFPELQLQAEISNLKKQSSGHLYFSLKDAHAQISAVIFAKDAALLKMAPKDGDNVIVEGAINVYPASGKYQLIVRTMRHVGLGELLLKLEELKREIHRRGWFSQQHKKALPKLPKVIGVVTSPTGAVIRDILNVLTRRFANIHVILNPVKVQGEGAAVEIARAIEEFNKYNLVDVIIVGRGGGSMEDLWPFNEEIAASAVFHSKIPIIAAVGHETDHCIVEYVADVRAPTPSAAAEIAIGEKSHMQQVLTNLQRRLDSSFTYIIRKYRDQLRAVQKQPLFTTPYSLLAPQMQQCDNLFEAINRSILNKFAFLHLTLDGRKRQLLAQSPKAKVSLQKTKLLQMQKSLNFAGKKIVADLRQSLNVPKLEKQLEKQWHERLKRCKEKLVYLAAALEAVNPKVLLNKGYCILASDKQQVISSVKQLSCEQQVHIILSDGHAEAVVSKVVYK